MHNKVSDKPRYKPSSKSKQKKEKFDDKEKQKAISIESMQEDENNLPSVGCRIRMLVGYGENGEMNATIITTKEEVDYQFWYPKRNKVIKNTRTSKTIILGMMSLSSKVILLKAQIHQRSVS